MTRLRNGLLCSAVVLAVLATGCAKRPAMTQAAAPPPTSAPVAAAPPPPAPAPAPEARPEPKAFVPDPQLEDVHFDFDKYAIRPDATTALDASATWLHEHADRAVLIEGHCDERGTEAYNLALGDRRAKAAMDYLVAHGATAGQITLISYGKERPQCTEHNEACWSRNRRAHFAVKPK